MTLQAQTTTLGADLLVEAMISNGITCTMNIAGLGMWSFVDAVHARRHEIQYISGVNETSIALMAEGWGRATQRPALVNVYFSSGTQLASVALSTAWADHVPLILMTTTPDQRLAARDPYAAVAGPITATTSQFTKWSCEVQSAEQFPEVIRRAVAISTASPRGPVHIAVPYNLLDDPVEFEPPAQPRIEPVVEGGAHDSFVHQLAYDLQAAQRPVIIAGGEVGQYGATADLQRICELSGAMVIETPGYVTHSPIRRDSDYRVGKLTEAVAVLDQADLVFLMCVELTQVAWYQGPIVEPGPIVVQLATSAEDIAKSCPVTSAAIGGVGYTARAIRDHLEAGGYPTPPWLPGQVEQRRAKLAERFAARRTVPGNAALEEVITRLPDYFGAKLTMVDHGNAGTLYVDGLTALPTDRYFSISSKASMQGWGLPAAIGAQIARPSERVVAVVGDGGFMFTSGALYTAARQRIPVTAIVVSNGGWGGGGYNYRIHDGYKGDLFVGDFADPPINVGAIAAGMGVKSFRIHDPAEVPAVLAEVARNQEPAVIEVLVAAERVRPDVPLMPPRTRGMSG